ncbi:MAG: glycosyltransferase family 2 protein, partial [Clostridia bacterium]|nr:glycosyltransferase family 2 protein [Clostridia bacterium]
MIKFSVIVPLYNCEKYIQECIDSVLSQTYQNFELLVVNDGSTDSSRKIVANYADSRIRIIDKENGGLLHARLTGLSEANNDYIVFVDADDRIAPTLLEDLAIRFSEGIDCVIYKLKEFSEKNDMRQYAGVFADKTIFGSGDRKSLLRLLFTTGKINSIVCKAFKKDLIPIETMKKYPRIAIGEDGLFTLHLLENYTMLIYLDYAYYEYRLSSQSMTHKLLFSNYTDNVFRLDLYNEKAKKYFIEEFEN